MSEAKDIILTIEISPVRNGKRKVVVSGAPEQEMPVIKVGAFPDLHRLVDGVWVELAKREPQVVKVTAPKTAAKPKAKKEPGAKGNDEAETDKGENETESEETQEAPAAEGVRKCRVCGCTDDHACEGGCTWVEPDLCSRCAETQPPTAPAKPLPVIEGDPTAPDQEQLTMEGLNG